MAFDLLSSPSTSTTSDERIGATDQTRVVGGRKGKLITDQAVDVSQNKGQIGGVQVKAGGDVTITSTDTQTLADLSALSTQTIADLAAQSSANLAGAQQANQSQVTGLIGELKTLAENQQTGGTAMQNKTVTIIVLAVLALGGFYVWRKL